MLSKKLLLMYSEFSQFHAKMHKYKKMLHCSLNFCNVLYKLDIVITVMGFQHSTCISFRGT